MDGGWTVLSSLLLTIGIECALAAGVRRTLRLEHRSRAFLLVSVAAVNLTSQPLAQWSAMMLGTSWPAFVTIESIVVLGETVLYRVLLREPWRRCAMFSLLLNGASASLGLLIF